MTREEVIEKIEKLLRMKRGGTPAEVETALALAAELARKHGINLNDVNPDRVIEEPIGHIDAATSARLGWEHKYASLVCQNFFNVTAMLTQDILQRYSGWGRNGPRGKSEFKIRLIGTAWDTQIALYVYRFLVERFRWHWNHSRGRARNRQAFLYGMFHGICTRLEEEKGRSLCGNPNALILLKGALAKRESYLDQTWPGHGQHSTVPDGNASVSKMVGFDAGRKVAVRTGLTNTGSASLLLE